MAQFSRIEVALAMNSTGIIPVFYHPDTEVCKQVAAACYKGGIRVFEFTNRGDFAHEVFTRLMKFANEQLPGMIIGAGSVVDPGTAALYIQLGANFIVSPALNKEMAAICNRRKILWSPGCGSLSEIGRAEELGAEVVKIFPAKEVGGPDFVKSVKAPCPWTSIMPTGGVEPRRENLYEWFKAGVWCVGMGSKLIPSSLVREGNYEKLAHMISETVDLVKEIRSNLNVSK